MGGVGLDGEVEQDTYLLVAEAVVRCELLAYLQLAQVVHAALRRHFGIDRPHGVGGGVYPHLAIEGGIERVLRAEMHQVRARHGVGEIIVVVGVAGGSERREETLAEDVEGVEVEIEVLRRGEQDGVVGGGEDECLLLFLARGAHALADELHGLGGAIEGQEECGVIRGEQARSQALP